MVRIIPCLLVFAALLVPATARAFTPAHIWSQRIGSTAGDSPNGLAVDGSGNVILAGYFSGTVDFGGGPLVSSAGSLDIFVAKYTALGVHLWSQRFGGTGTDAANSVAVDPSGNVILTGSYTGTVDFGGGNIAGIGGVDIFLASYNSAGTHVWSKGYGGGGTDSGSAVAATTFGDVLVTGTFSSIATLGSGPTISAGGTDIFVEKYSFNGAHQWTKAFGAASNDNATSIAVDGSNNVIITGGYIGTVDFGGGNLASAGSEDMYFAKYNPAGTHQWSQRFGGSSIDRGQDIAVDASGNVVLTGYFQGTVDFGGGGLANAGGTDIVVAKYNSAGTHQWSRRAGGTVTDVATSVSIDGSGHVLLGGYFSGTLTFPVSMTSAGSSDALVARYDAAGTLVWMQRFGSNSTDQVRCVAADASGNAFATGIFSGTVDFGGGDLVSAGSLDVFFAKFSADPSEPQVTSITDIGNDQGRQVLIHVLRSAYDLAGSTRPILRYEAYRREDPTPAAMRAALDPSGLSIPELLAAGWTEVATVAAHGEPSYGIVAPTVGDSTVTLGPYHSVFYVRAATDEPSVFFDSPADSGYSLDNLAPGVPLNFTYASGDLAWDESAAVDFDFFTVYGSNVDAFGSATVVDYSIANAMDVSGSPYVYYFVTATDFSGNEGNPAKVNTLSGVGGTPKNYVLSVSNYPNPFNPRTTVSYTVPSRGAVSISIYDTRGALVATLFHGERDAGAYTTEWDGRTDSGITASSAVYFARIAHASGTRSKKMVLLK